MANSKGKSAKPAEREDAHEERSAGSALSSTSDTPSVVTMLHNTPSVLIVPHNTPSVVAVPHKTSSVLSVSHNTPSVVVVSGFVSVGPASAHWTPAPSRRSYHITRALSIGQTPPLLRTDLRLAPLHWQDGGTHSRAPLPERPAVFGSRIVRQRCVRLAQHVQRRTAKGNAPPLCRQFSPSDGRRGGPHLPSGSSASTGRILSSCDDSKTRSRQSASVELTVERLRQRLQIVSKRRDCNARAY